MRQRVTLPLAILLCVVGSIVHGQVDERFDTSRAVVVTGSVAGAFFPMGTAGYLLIERQNQGGATDRWALQGSALDVLVRAGWTPKVPLGQMVTAKAYPLKPNVDGGSVVDADAPAQVVAAATANRLMHGIEVTFADGRTLPFGPLK